MSWLKADAIWNIPFISVTLLTSQKVTLESLNVVAKINVLAKLVTEDGRINGTEVKLGAQPNAVSKLVIPKSPNDTTSINLLLVFKKTIEPYFSSIPEIFTVYSPSDAYVCGILAV